MVDWVTGQAPCPVTGPDGLAEGEIAINSAIAASG